MKIFNRIPATLVVCYALTGSLPVLAQTLPVAPPQDVRQDSHVVVLYLTADGKFQLFDYSLGPNPGLNWPMSSLDKILKGQFEDDGPGDMLFMADPSRSAADVSRAIAAAKAAGFRLYQAPTVKK